MQIECEKREVAEFLWKRSFLHFWVVGHYFCTNKKEEFASFRQRKQRLKSIRKSEAREHQHNSYYCYPLVAFGAMARQPFCL
jgi:hypothetical protein